MELTRPNKNSICAVIVTYHPDEGLAARVAEIASQVGGVIIVDNGSESHEVACIRGMDLHCPYDYVQNQENKGIATALNQGLRRAQERGFAWALTFDQDSAITEGFVLRLTETYDAFPTKDKLAIIGANFIHTQHGVPGYPASDFTYGSGEGWYEVVMAITSGSLMSLAAYVQIGPFIDALFIDHVDTEYCLRARAQGFHIIVTSMPLMEHAVGRLTPKRFLGRQVWTFNYSPQRWYFRTRNHVFLLRRFFLKEPRWLTRTVNDLIRSWVKLALFETQAFAKLRAALCGVLHGLSFRPER